MTSPTKLSAHRSAGIADIVSIAAGSVLAIPTAQAKPITIASDSGRQPHFASGIIIPKATVNGASCLASSIEGRLEHRKRRVAAGRRHDY